VSQLGSAFSVTIGGTCYQVGGNLTTRQWMFMNAAEEEQLYGGAKRGGKSVAICCKLVALAFRFPGNRLGLFRQKLTDLRESTLVTFERVVPKELYHHHHTYRRITFHTYPPSVLIYGGLQDENEVVAVGSKEFGAIALDEPSEIDPEVYKMLVAQLCWRLPSGQFPPYMAMLGSNPEPGWVEERFRDLILQVSPDHPTAVDGSSRRYILALPRDNPYLPPKWEEKQRYKGSSVWIKKYLEGSWEVSEGQVYKDFHREIHCIGPPPPAYLKQLSLGAALDYGSTGVVCCGIKGVDPAGNIISLGEYYESNKLISEHAVGIRELLAFWARACGKESQAKRDWEGQHGDPQEGIRQPDWSYYAYEVFLIDPSTQAKTQQTKFELMSIQEMFYREGLPTVAAFNAVDSGIEAVREYLKVKPLHIHPFQLGPDGKQLRGAPSWFVIEANNPNGVREMINWKSTVTDTGKKKYVGMDHWLDCDRYFINSRPEPPSHTAADVITLSTHAQIALRTHEAWAKKFLSKQEGAHPNQWTPGI
jgi:hypothetical protein